MLLNGIIHESSCSIGMGAPDRMGDRLTRCIPHLALRAPCASATLPSFLFLSASNHGFGNVMPFLRYGHSSSGAAALKNMLAAGVGFYQAFGHNSDGFGFGVSWGEPFGAQARDQSGVESYFRVQLTNEIAITPNIQYVKNPANNPDADSTFVFSFRIRAAF